tara:strand:- start:669 stop:956 length:288 start_codon:yes stop_codon:yes gene_type:complete
MNSELYLSVIYQSIRDAVSSDSKKVYKAYDWFGSEDFDEICELANVNANSLRKSLLHLRGSESPKETADNMISSIRAMVWSKKVGEENSSIKLDS